MKTSCLAAGLAAALVLPGLAPAQGGPPPFDHDLAAAVSSDGLRFEYLGPFVENAGVPCVVQGHGLHVAIFQWFPENDPAAFNRIARRISGDGGVSWGPILPVEILGAPEPHAPPVDPALVPMANGEWRLYFTTQLQSRPFPETFSAISRDLLHFQWEPGTRFGLPGAPLLDPAVVFFQGTWHYYAPKPGQPGVAIHATSRDGLNFRPEPDIFLPGMDFLGNAMVFHRPAGVELRFYGTEAGRPGCVAAASPDGFQWHIIGHSPPGPLADPAVSPVANGKFLALVTHLR